MAVRSTQYRREAVCTRSTHDSVVRNDDRSSYKTGTRSILEALYSNRINHQRSCTVRPTDTTSKMLRVNTKEFATAHDR